MYTQRKTAVLHLTMSGVRDDAVRALSKDRDYQFNLLIGDTDCGGGIFHSPLDEDTWDNVARAMRELPETEKGKQRSRFDEVYNAGVRLYDTLADIRPLLKFLSEETGPRRLVIRSNRPEIHLIPWEAMINEDKKLLAHGDVSIVRSTQSFNPHPWIFGADSDGQSRPLNIRGLFGPGVQELSFQALKELHDAAAKQNDQGLSVEATKEKTLSDDWLKTLQAEIIHIEAHGSLSGNVEMPDWFNARDPIELVEKLNAAELILLWSCYSGMIHSWGKSLGMRFHERGAKFVLCFSTPLRYETSGAIANRFYTSVFSSRDPLDPETAIVEERKHLHQEDLMTCDWAAMTLWLRQPVDLSAAVLNGPRLPEGSWGDERVEFENKLINKVAPGRVVLLTNQQAPVRMPYTLTTAYRGAAVYLKGTDGLKDHSLFEKLGAEPAALKSHPADRFILLLDTLERYPRSLLIWSDVNEPELKMIELLSTEIPKTLDVVLISPADLKPKPHIVVIAGGNTAQGSTAESDLERFFRLAEADQFKDAAALWKELNPGYDAWDDETKVRYQRNGYWSFIRAERARAEACIQEVEKLDRVEGYLLRGNYQDRSSMLAEAQKSYEDAAESATLPRDKARAWLELAYLVSKQGSPLAEDYYRRTIETLETVDEASRDQRWGSALGRALRDFADYLIDKSESDNEGAAGEEVDNYLKRAMAIHAIDNRLNQVAAVLRTRGRLERQRKQWKRAEASLFDAVSIFALIGNEAGWFSTIRELVVLSTSQNQHEQAIVTLRGTLARLNQGNPDEFKKEKGLLSLQMANLYWSRGALDDAKTHYQLALDNLPKEFSNQRAEAQSRYDLCNTLSAN